MIWADLFHRPSAFPARCMEAGPLHNAYQASVSVVARHYFPQLIKIGDMLEANLTVSTSYSWFWTAAWTLPVLQREGRT